MTNKRCHHRAAAHDPLGGPQVNARRTRKKPPHRTARQLLSCLFLAACCVAAAWAAGPIAGHLHRTPQPLAGADRSDGEDRAWCLLLVNKWNYIPYGYEPDLIKLQNGESVDIRIAPALEAMLHAAREEGVYATVVSGYRTQKQQQRLLNAKVANYRAEGYDSGEAAAMAEAWVALPGTSEHQIGLAVDIGADGNRSTPGEVYAWFEQNSYRFGFIRRYPADKTHLTGVIYEPWHYRYVGIEAAADLHQKGLCLEEYLGESQSHAG